MRSLGIDSQTLFGLPPLEHLQVAARTGCSHLSLGLQPMPWKLNDIAHWSLRDDPLLRRNLLAALRDHNLFIALAEGFVLRAGADIRERGADLDLFAELGARWASTVCMDPNRPRALDQLGMLAEMTRVRGIGLLLEYAPPHSVNSLDAHWLPLKTWGCCMSVW